MKSHPGAASGVGAPDDSNAVNVAFPPRWREKANQLRRSSPFGHFPGWRLVPVIVKSNDDLRQEQFVSQLLQQFSAIWRRAGIPCWVRPYDILATSRGGGLIEAIPDTVSLDALKRGDPAFTTLGDWFTRYFHRGKYAAKRLRLARSNFARSLAGYSLVCYLLQIKDRHNGNILLDANGHIIHIDFGFLLTNSPGGNIGFEADFKLTPELVDVMGGPDSREFAYFRSLVVRGFLEVRRHHSKITLLVEMMLAGNSSLPCFLKGGAVVMAELTSRLHVDASRQECERVANELIDQSFDSWRTRWYDKIQRWTQGIRS
jgi:phosphatidylinositol 4-kinase B